MASLWSVPTFHHLLVLTSALIAIGLVYASARTIYNIYFHPLSSFPGPKSHAATIYPYLRSLVSGRLPFDVRTYHEVYGDVVRIGPNELSYASAEAWNDIYGHRHGKENMEKEHFGHGPNAYGAESIITADDTQHARYRRLLAYAFSDKALRAQEHLMIGYIDLFIQRLHEVSKGNSPVDMVSWYNFLTFDMIGDLAFGESFHCLDTSDYHPWVKMIFDGVKANTYFNAVKRFPALASMLKPFIPKKVLDAKAAHTGLVIAKTKQRLEMKTEKADFTTFILRNQATDLLTLNELQANSEVLIIAGSETTATLLCGVTFHLIKNPDVMKKLCEEIRSAFATEKEINITNCNNLKYMLAVLDEALRIFPASPSGHPRIVPAKGEMMGGMFVPGGTTVSANPWATFHSSQNFTDPDLFVPERFLGDPRYATDKKSALQPFSAGPRNCLGRNLAYSEMRLILARVLWNFDLSLAPECQNWADEQLIYFLWEKSPLIIHLTPVNRACG